MYEDMILITKKWKISAIEYSKFLNRHGIDNVCVITDRSNIGPIMSIYANEDKYLELSYSNDCFSYEERQLNELLDTIQNLFEILIDIEDSDDNSDYMDDSDNNYLFIDFNEDFEEDN